MATTPTVHDRNRFFYGYEELEGKPATMHFLPSERSRKWRRGFSVKAYSERAWNTAMELVRSGDIHSFKFMEGN